MSWLNNLKHKVKAYDPSSSEFNRVNSIYLDYDTWGWVHCSESDGLKHKCTQNLDPWGKLDWAHTISKSNVLDAALHRSLWYHCSWDRCCYLTYVVGAKLDWVYLNVILECIWNYIKIEISLSEPVQNLEMYLSVSTCCACCSSQIIERHDALCIMYYTLWFVNLCYHQIILDHSIPLSLFLWCDCLTFAALRMHKLSCMRSLRERKLVQPDV